MRTIHLRERRPRDLHLPADVVRTLIGLPSRPLDLVPLGGRRWRVTPRGVAGVLLTSSVRFHIRPKLPLGNLLRLIDPDLPLPAEEDFSQAHPGGEVLTILVRRLLELLTQRVRAGLRRDYVEVKQTDGFARGRIDIGEQMRKTDRRPDRFETRTSEWTVDQPSNRLPRSTIEFLLAHPLVDPVSRSSLRSMLGHFREVTSVPLNPRDFDPMPLDRLHADYAPLLDLCRRLAGMLTTAGETGSSAVPAFLLEMDHLFEGWIGRGLRERLPKREVALQSSLAVFDSPDSAVLRPDILISKRGKVVRVLDVKWKSLHGGMPTPADLHQILSYSLLTGCRRVGLVYPGSANALRRHRVTGSDVEVAMMRVQVTGDADAGRRALAWLAERAG